MVSFDSCGTGGSALGCGFLGTPLQVGQVRTGLLLDGESEVEGGRAEHDTDDSAHGASGEDLPLGDVVDVQVGNWSFGGHDFLLLMSGFIIGRVISATQWPIRIASLREFS